MVHLWPKWHPKAALSMLAMLAIVACTSATPASPTPVPTPTPTATPIPTPTPDLEQQADDAVKEMLWLYNIMFPAEYEAVLNHNDKTQNFASMLFKYYPMYAAFYLAVQCHNGQEASPEGFRKFAEGFLPSTVTVKDTIKQIISRAQARKQLGLSSITEPCKRPYIAPQSAAEAELATGLIRAVYVYSLIPELQPYAVAALKGFFPKWIIEKDAQDIGFLEWYCDRSGGACD